MKSILAFLSLLQFASFVKGDVDAVCLAVNCGLQSGACFLDSECNKVIIKIQ